MKSKFSRFSYQSTPTTTPSSSATTMSLSTRSTDNATLLVFWPINSSNSNTNNIGKLVWFVYLLISINYGINNKNNNIDVDNNCLFSLFSGQSTTTAKTVRPPTTSMTTRLTTTSLTLTTPAYFHCFRTVKYNNINISNKSNSKTNNKTTPILTLTTTSHFLCFRDIQQRQHQ